MTSTVAARNTALEIHNGKEIGRDPRNMTAEEFLEAGIIAQSPLRAIRQYCLERCAEKPSEVRKCVMFDCPLWSFRLGTNPHSKRVMSPEQRLAASERMKALHATNDKDNNVSEGAQEQRGFAFLAAA